MLSTEAKVGSVTVVGVILFVFMIMRLGSFSFGEQGYLLNVDFNKVNGLKEGNVVRYIGVDVGKVKSVGLAPQGGVRVALTIQPDTKIPVGSRFQIGTDGLLGEKFIDIIPPAEVTGYLDKGATVRGDEPQGMDHLLSSAEKVLSELNKLLVYFNDIIGDPNVRQGLKDTVLNAREMTAHLNQLSIALERMAVNNESDVRMMVTNFRMMSESLNSVAGRVDTLVAAVDNNGQTAADLVETIQNVKDTSIRVERMAAALEGVVTDPETAQNIKETLRNTRQVTEKANKMLSRVGAMKVSGGIDSMYNFHENRYRFNADFRLDTSPQDFAVLGVTGIGDDNRFNLQMGRNSGIFSSRFGIVEGKAGIGMDAGVRDGMRFSVDVYDPNEVKVKLRAQVPLSADNYLIGQTDSVNREAERNTYFGIRHSF